MAGGNARSRTRSGDTTPPGDDAAMERRAGAFYGRRKAKPLTLRQQHLFDTLLPELALDIAQAPPPAVGALFARPMTQFRLEIGFGGGEHLIDQAAKAPDTGFIGVEPFINGMAKALSAIDEAGLDNIRLFDEDAARLLDWLPGGQFARVDLLYPDPWPKRRHWKRRFVSPENLERIVRLLEPGGEFRFASDIDHYVNWTLLHCKAHPQLQWTAQKACDWHMPWQGWPGTRYEAKAIREGRRPAYLIFRRI